MKRSLAHVLLLSVVTLSTAQTVFIPDTTLRNRLNDFIPGIVDVNGWCDTATWNAVPPLGFSIAVNNVPDGLTLDLEGIQHLKMDRLWLVAGAPTTVTVLFPGYPLANTTLLIEDIDLQQIQGPVFPLPQALDEFSCDACGLTTIPDFDGSDLTLKNLELSGPQTLPISVSNLTMANCGISSLPPLPDGLNYLYLYDDSLANWPSLPTLVSLHAERIGLPDPPDLPENLSIFVYEENGMTVLPPLPDGLDLLGVNDNMLTTLPFLPPTLQSLSVENNPINALPMLPGSIDNVHADGCPLISLQDLPTGLTDLENRYNPLLACLPVLPNTLENLKLFGTSVTCLPNIPPNMYLLGGEDNLGIAAVLCNLGNAICPIVDPLVDGTVFNDVNANGVQDGGESVRPFATIEAQPGNFLAGSNWDGNYVLPVDTGNFTVTGQPTLYEGTTTAPYAVSFASIGEVDSLNDIGYEVVPGIYDLVATLEAAPTRPGFETTVWASIENVGTEATNASVDLTFDAALEYVESSYTPQSQNGSLVEWNAGLLYPGTSWTVAVTLYTPPGVAIGTPLVHTATAMLGQSDTTPPDNIAVLNDTVVGSYDPNDKRVRPEMMTPDDVAMGAPVTWTIRFQNTGTFAAERVLITDTLSTDLRWNTMDVIASSHAYAWYILNGVLHVLFEDINLPDSVSDEAGSHGFVKFGMKPQASLPDGAQVENVANIYFDFNGPVITAPAIFTVDASTSVHEQGRGQGLCTWPNPVEDVLYIGGLPSGVSTLLEVVDIHGAVVRALKNVTGPARIDMHDQATGAYALRVSCGATTTTSTFIKR